MSSSQTLQDAFYAACLEAGTSGLTTTDFLSNHTCDSAELAKALNSLLEKGIVETFCHGGNLVFKALSEEEVKRSGSVQGQEQLVYNAIRAAGDEGIWTKHIKANTNLHHIVIKRCLKALEQKSMVKSVKSVKHPTRKLYMLMELAPSIEVTGGPWFTDQELDEEFIETLTKECFKFVQVKVHTYITARGISHLELTVEDIVMLLDVLVYDGKIERFTEPLSADWDDGDEDDLDTDSGWIYKAVTRGKGETSAWQNCPCGVCPMHVANFCTETGPVNPNGCSYYDQWLGCW
ncbi:34-kDa subunit of RNA polymerase III (C) [Mortierella alpina]|nr:34-kDa subunit of RNA polymerase III (C) [Mortierella alpina]